MVNLEAERDDAQNGESEPLVLISLASAETVESTESDGIKGCSYIYAPRGQALEYASLACNPYRGCGHKCAYCYVPRVLHMHREEFDAGAVPRPDFAWERAHPVKAIKGKHGEPVDWDGFSSLFLFFAEKYAANLTESEKAWVKALKNERLTAQT